MRQLRESQMVKVFGSGLVLSLVLTILAPLVHVYASPADDTFSNWLRAQVPVEHDEHFQQAISAAEDQHAEHLSDFIRAFVDAHPAPEQLAHAMGADLDADLFALLATSSETFGNVAVAPRLLAAASVLSTSVDRLSSAAAVVLPDLLRSETRISQQNIWQGDQLVYAFELFSEAEPRGP